MIITAIIVIAIVMPIIIKILIIYSNNNNNNNLTIMIITLKIIIEIIYHLILCSLIVDFYVFSIYNILDAFKIMLFSDLLIVFTFNVIFLIQFLQISKRKGVGFTNIFEKIYIFFILNYYF